FHVTGVQTCARPISAVAEISRAHAQRLIGDGRAVVDGERRRASDRLAGGELVHVELTAPPDDSLEAESIPLSVAYEDADMLIVATGRAQGRGQEDSQ